jgi:RHS repeat-associated protein
VRERYHNATGTGALNSPAGPQPKARVTYSATWQDALGRTVAVANYGTNGGSSLTRPSTVPARSDTVLVTSMKYNSAGDMHEQMNPGGIKTCFEFDAVGRQVKQVLNCTDASSSSSSSSSSSGAIDTDDVNVTVLTAYNADGNVSSITAKNQVTGDQTTTYVYGTTLSDSEIASSLLKRKEIYPDSVDADDVIAFEYNRQGEVTEMKDQNGTIHAYDFDKLGRQTQDRVTTLGTDVDGAVRRIATTFEVRGMKEKLTSYDNATVGSGSIVNEVQFAYNDFGQVAADYQSHSGAVNTGTTPKVQYSYANGSANTIRQTGIMYPNARVITSDYGAANGADDALSRVASIVDDDMASTHLADYSYLGLNTFVEVDYTEPEIEYTLVGAAGGDDPDTGDIYRGFDRFGRIKDSYWYNYGSSADVDRIKYGYDRNGSRLYRENTVAAALGKSFDELYTYDVIDRLKSMDRGDLTALKDAINNLQFAQDWRLDATGNWQRFRVDEDGTGGWELDQTRVANKVNEITDITETAGPSWVTPAYSRAGNMTTIPKPADPTAAFTATYDAWNRLVKIADGGNTVAEYSYDGAKRRTVKKIYVGGVLDETRHFYYSEPSRWQVLEERIGSSSNAQRHFVWGHRYVDDLILRDRDADADGSLDERLYGLQDGNWNLTVIVDVNGSPQERFAYDSYGTSRLLTPLFTSRSSSNFDWERRFAGYEMDPESILYYVRTRSYAPRVAWLQRDPTKFSDGFSLYAYVRSSPCNYVDPFGLMCTTLFDPCSGNKIGCACAIVGWLDSLPIDIPFGISKLLSLADCGCDVIDVMVAYCQSCNLPPTILNLIQFGGTLVISAASCIINIVQILGDTSEVFQEAELVIQFFEDFILDPLGFAGGGIPPQPLQCVFYFTDCVKGLGIGPTFPTKPAI